MPLPVATSTIASQAFRLMELRPISSFADDSDQARAAAEQYPIALKMCLEASDWEFASVSVNLPEAALPAGNAIDPKLPYSYMPPADCVIMREVGDKWTHWRVDRDLLRASDAGPLLVRYTGMITNEARLPATFQTAVAYRLAALLAPTWNGTASKATMLESGAGTALKSAMKNGTAQSSAERYDGREDQSDWVENALR